MKTIKRFTPDLLDRFQEQGRGEGTYKLYVPWHQVSRSDPASYGRSNQMTWGGRQRNLLSDDEFVACLFALLTPDLDDMREQFPLSLESGSHELGAYNIQLGSPGHPGTLEIARKLGHRHPRVNGNGRSAPWVITTDLLLTLVDQTAGRRLLAVSCKPTANLSDRSKALLSIEREYWAARDVEWLLITPGEYDQAVELTLRNSFHWGLGEPVSDEARATAVQLARSHEGLPFSIVLNRIEDALGRTEDYAQRAFWQSIWKRELPIDLRRGWRPHLPNELLTPLDFLALNPVACRRSAWN